MPATQTRQLFKCADCQFATDRLNVIQTRRQTGDSPAEYDQVCEKCGSENVFAAVDCARCGDTVFTDEVDRNGECEECRTRPEAEETRREARVITSRMEGWD